MNKEIVIDWKKNKDDRDSLLESIKKQFALTSSLCEHKWQNDCGHPDQDFNCMLCCLQNCPLLLGDEK